MTNITESRPVLLLDCNQSTGKAAKELLGAAGYKVETAADYSATIAKLEKDTNLFSAVVVGANGCSEWLGLLVNMNKKGIKIPTILYALFGENKFRKQTVQYDDVHVVGVDALVEGVKNVIGPQLPSGFTKNTFKTCTL